MKKNQMMMIMALCALSAAVSAQEDNIGQKPQVVASATAEKAAECGAAKLTIEEMAFAAKLNDANRKAFIEKLTVEQRHLAMEAVKSASIANAADEAVLKIFNSKDLAVAEQVNKAEIASSEESFEEDSEVE